MASKKKILKVSAIVFIVVLLVALVTLNYIIPLVIKSIILPTVEKQLGVKKLNCDIRRIGISGADLGSVSIQGEGRSALNIKSIQVNYSLIDILRGRVGTLILSGITLSAEIKDGNIIISGLDYRKFITADGNKKKDSSGNKASSSANPLLMRELQISNLTLIVRHENRKFTMPVNFKLTAPENSMNELKCVLNIWPRDHKVSINIDVFMKKKEIAFKVNTVDVINLARFQDFAEYYLPGLVLSGKLAIEAEGIINPESLHIKKLFSKISLDDSHLRYSGVEFCNLQDSAGKNIPASVSISGADNNIDIGINDVSFSKPLPFAINPVKLNLNWSGDSLKLKGSYRFTLSPKNLPANLESLFRVLKPVDLDGALAGGFSSDASWFFKFADDPGIGKNEVQKKRVSTELNGTAALSLLLPVYEFEAVGKGTDIFAKLRFKAPDLILKDKNFSASLPLTDLRSSIKISRLAGKNVAVADLSFSSPDISANYAAAKLSIKDFTASAKVTEDMKVSAKAEISSLDASQGAMSFSAPSIRFEAGTILDASPEKTFSSAITLKELSFNDSASSFNVSGINAAIPLKWPCPKTLSGGKMRVEKIGFGGLDSATVDMNIAQKESSFSCDGTLAFEPLGATCGFNASGGMAKDGFALDMKFAMPETVMAEPVDMASVHPSAKDIFFNGAWSFSGAMSYGKNGMKSSLETKLKNAKIDIKKSNLVIDNVSFDLKLNDLLNFKSEPKQNIAFGSASMGNIAITDGKIEYQIESLKSVFVEKGSMKWCGGNVYIHAMRFAPGINDYTMTLYCDHINLAQMLGQFGAAQAEGSGSLNGKVPLRFADGKLTFEEGFFFSIPGEGGSIHLTKSEVLSNSIAQSGAPVELELAQAALGDFSYEWARINLTTEGENLLMNLKLDGKPAEVLPFVYDREEGRFMKTKANLAGSKFQGIRLDVNFRLPINRILEYSKGTKNVLDNLK